MAESGDISSYGFFRQLTALPFIDAIYLYGSRARGEQERTSDIDLAIRCPQADAKDWAAVREIIGQADTLLEIDCVRLDMAAEELKNTIFREGKLLYEKP